LDADKSKFEFFVKVTLDSILPYCNNLNKLRYILSKLYPIFIEPSEEDGSSDQNQWKKLKPHLSNVVANLLKGNIEIAKSQLQTSSKSDHRAFVQLPKFAKYLLIASYLAANVPAAYDNLLYTLKNVKKPEASKLKNSTKRFNLNRMIWIFHKIVDQKHKMDLPLRDNTLLIHEIGTLVSMSLLTKSSTESTLYTCGVDFEFISEVSKSVGADINKYLAVLDQN